MSLQLVQALRAAVVNLLRVPLDSGICRIYAGAVPATADVALSGQTLLAAPLFNAVSAPASTTGQLTFNAITEDASADASGTPTFARWYEDDGATLVGQCTVSVVGGGGDIQFAYVPFVAATPIGIASLSVTQPA